VTRQVERKR